MINLQSNGKKRPVEQLNQMKLYERLSHGSQLKTASKSKRGTMDKVLLSAATSENANDVDEEESKSMVRTKFNVDEAIKEMQHERFF